MIIDSQLEKELIALLNDYAVKNSDIVPDFKHTAKLGYTYKAFDAVLSGQKFSSSKLLSVLFDRNLLSREIHDRMFSCPQCKTCHLHLRETCPSCQSLNWDKKILYHHFACGYVGLESEFKAKSAEDLFCPKCEEELRHIGLDYEKPTESFYCLSCSHIFNDHDIEGACLCCGKLTPLDDLKAIEFFKYKINKKTLRAIEEQSLKVISIEDVLQDKMSATYTLDYLGYFLERQRMVAQAYKEAIAVLVATGDKVMDFSQEAKASLPYSYLVGSYKDTVLICGTRESFKEQKNFLEAFVEDYFKESQASLVISIYGLDLTEKVKPQILHFIKENDKREDEEVGLE